MSPLVSVVIASYNHDRFLRQNLDSVLAQTHRDLEIVAVDDGSTDGSLATLQEYASQHPGRVRVFAHPQRENRGIYATLNRAIAEARGEYIAVQGSDDAWLPRKLERQLEAFAADPAVGAVYAQAYLVDQSGAHLRTAGQAQVYGRVADDLVATLLEYNVVPAMSIVYRAVLVPSPAFAEDLLYADWDLNLRLALRTRMVGIAEPLVLYRRHAGAVTHTGAIVRDGIAHRLALLGRVLDYPELKRRPDLPRLRRAARAAAAEHALHLAGAAAALGDRASAWRNVRWAFGLAPGVPLRRPRELGGVALAALRPRAREAAR
jgi:glycosyltransferase involved in cell wall biosynthesis